MSLITGVYTQSICNTMTEKKTFAEWMAEIDVKSKMPWKFNSNAEIGSTERVLDCLRFIGIGIKTEPQ